MTPDDWKGSSDWERRNMTVCIAATTDYTEKPKFLICADSQISSSLGSAQIGHKVSLIRKGWIAMYAGSPDAGKDIHTRLRDSFIHDFDRPIDETAILAKVRKVLSDRKKMLCDEYTQGKFGMSHDEFLKRAKAELPDNRHYSATVAMENLLLGADCIIAGYCLGFPLIIETNQECRAFIRDNFAAIGDGGYLAHSSLMHRAHDERVPLQKAIYHIYEAKKWAERNRTVGDMTNVTIFYDDGRYDIVTMSGKQFLGTEFEKYGPKAVPENLATPEGFFFHGKYIEKQ